MSLLARVVSRSVLYTAPGTGFLGAQARDFHISIHLRIFAGDARDQITAHLQVKLVLYSKAAAFSVINKGENMTVSPQTAYRNLWEKFEHLSL